MEFHFFEGHIQMQASLLEMARAVARSEHQMDQQAVAASPAIDLLTQLAMEV